MSRGNKLQTLSELQKYNKELSDYELKQILNIYKNVIYRIENRRVQMFSTLLYIWSKKLGGLNNARIIRKINYICDRKT